MRPSRTRRAAALLVGVAALLVGCTRPSPPDPTPARGAWSVDLGAAVVGEPVVADGAVLAATEANRVVALDPATGRIRWSRTVGTPLTGTAAVVGCGNLDPLGITSTPVVDPATHTVFVLAEVRTGDSSVEHRLVALDTRSGRIVRTAVADPPLPVGETPLALLQRPGLVLAGGRVYAAFGGNSGDCGHYHGWVVGLPADGEGESVHFEVAPDGEGGAIWMSGGAPAVDAAGNLYVTTGNANPGPPEGGPDPKRYTESVVKLSPTLMPLASFKDRIAGGDEDLSTGPPVLLPGGRVVVVGKTDVAYVLATTDLHRVAAIPRVCGSDPDGTPAYDPATERLLVPCRAGGLQEVDLRANRLGRLLPGPNGSPVIDGSTVRALLYPDGVLTAFDARRGTVLSSERLGVEVPHFATPVVAGGLVLIGTERGVTAVPRASG
jgi:polyvinyl alcohol dehydrogenase (cytochrome)